MAGLKLPSGPWVDPFRMSWLWEDFNEFASNTGGFTTTVTGTAAWAVSGEIPNGIATLTADATTDNSGGTVATENEIAKHAAGKPIVAVARAGWAEPDTNKTNFAFGFCEAWANGVPLADNGAATGFNSVDHALILVQDSDSRYYRFRTGDGTTNNVSVSTTPTVNSASIYHAFKIVIEDQNGVFIAMPFVAEDGLAGFKPLIDATTLQPIQHRITSASAGFDIGVGAKSGSATGTQSLRVDYIGVGVAR